MRPRLALLLLGGLLVASCSSSSKARPDGDTGDAAMNQDVGGLVPCLDQPTDLPRPPGGRLPCDLVPPGLQR